jgi:hypothetical protein
MSKFFLSSRHAGHVTRAFLRIAVLFLGACSATANASGWVEVGDRTLRSDIEILAAHGLIDKLTTTWPIPDGQILKGLSDPERLANEPAFVRLAADRVLAYLHNHGESHAVTPGVDARFTSSPNTIRDFGETARDKVDVHGGLDWSDDTVHTTLRAGVHAGNSDNNAPRATLDGSYVSTVWENVQFYGGWVDQWYGPGWTSSLILSNNAKPFPKIGLMRDHPHAFETRWLSWIGPWQANFFVGLLDGPRIDRHTYIANLRLTFNPIAGLEIGLNRITQFCGEHHPCHPLSAAFHVRNDEGNVNETNDEASIEFKYLGKVGSMTISPYVQFMNEDTGPFAHAVTSYLTGTSLAGPWGESGSHWRLTAEYTDSVATLNWFSFSNVVHGGAYNNRDYLDGLRYRDRTLGFSLDSDSRLLSLAGSVIDASGWTYRVVFYSAQISTPQLAAIQASGSNTRNVVSAKAVSFSQGEAGLSIPVGPVLLDVTVRAQTGQVHPGRDSAIGGEVGLRYPL